MKKVFILILSLLFLVSCQGKPERTVNVTNPNFKPELLFEIDGYRVYRFEDNLAETVYFVIPNGSAHWQISHGKGQKTNYDVYTAEPEVK